MHARVIGDDDDESTDSSGVGEGHERVGGNVKADVFHGDDGPGPGIGGADGHFEGNFLVRRPFGIDVRFECGDGFEDFGGWGSGVAGGDSDAGLIGAARYGLVTGEELEFSGHEWRLRLERGGPEIERGGIENCKWQSS
jgi:hypothetical protein